MEFISHIPGKEKYHFPYNLQNKIKKLNEEEKDLIQINKNYIENRFWKWIIDNNFRFNIPPTIFKVKKTIDIPNQFQHKSNQTEYASKNITGSKFTPEILQKIWEKGQFEIESKQKGLPYTWKLSNFMIKGIKNVILRYLKDMSISFLFIYTIKNRFSLKNYEYFSYSFFSAIYSLYLTVFNLLDLLFGMPMYRNNEHELTEKIKKEELKYFVSLNPNFTYKMFDKKVLKKEIYKIDDAFKNKWNNEILPEKLKLYKQQKLSKSQISLNIKNDEKIEFRKFMSNYPYFKELKRKYKSIEEFLQSQQIIINEKFIIDEEYEKKMSLFKKELEKHSIKIFCEEWRYEKENNYSTNLRNEQEIKLNKILKEKLEDKKEPFIIYSFNMNNKKIIPEKLKQMKKEIKSPLREYRAARLELMPYEVKKEVTNGKVNYYINKRKYYYVKTNFFCWRIWLFIIKLFTTFCNYNIRVYRQMTSSMIGIKALFLTELF